MLKGLLILVILSYSLVLIGCNEDEFAEFDEFSPDESTDFAKTPAKQASPDVQKQPASNRQPEMNNGNDEIQPVGSDSKLEPDVDNANQDKPKTKADLKLVNVPSIRHIKIESSAKNQKFAQCWFEQSRDLLKQQFALVGGAPTLNDTGAQKRDDEVEAYLATLKKQRGLIKASESLFTIWSSGRVGMEGLLVEINLLKRQDLFSMALNLMKASKDTLTLRFALGQEPYENFVFCIAHRSQAPKLVRDMVDINTFCPKRKPMSQLGFDIDKQVVMSELTDVSTFIFDQKTVAFLKKYERNVNYIHITDHFCNDRSEEISAMQKLAHPKRIATFSFVFPQSAEERTDYIMFSLGLLDRLRRFKLARDSKQKSEKNRQKITEYVQKVAFNLRQEAVQAKKDELRRLEKERIYNEDDPEKQRRWEKKEAKREQKRNKMRVKQLRVKSM